MTLLIRSMSGSTGLKNIKIFGSAAALSTVEARSASEGVKDVRSYMTKIVAQNYLLPNTNKLLAQCLGIPILFNRVELQKYTWIETFAGIRVGKIKHGKYNINTLHNVLYPIFIKMIEPSIIYKPSQFINVREHWYSRINIGEISAKKILKPKENFLRRIL